MGQAQEGRGQSLVQHAPVALAAGALWALIGLVRGATIVGYLQLVIGGAFTQWVLLASAEHLRTATQLRARLLPLVGLGSLLSVVVAWVLLVGTHHRPLGAVVFALSTLSALVVGFGAVRLLASFRVSFVAIGIALLGVAMGSAAALTAAGMNPLLIECVLGLILFAVGFSTPGLGALRVEAAWSRAVLGVLVFGAAALFLFPSWATVAQTTAPVVLGIPGLGR